MKKLFFLLISVLFASQTFAQSSIAKGSKVTILEIAKGDTSIVKELILLVLRQHH